MNARELQEKAESIKLEYEGTDDTIQLLVLQVWANIAVSLERLVEVTENIRHEIVDGIKTYEQNT